MKTTLISNRMDTRLNYSYISMKMDPNGRMPPSATITAGSMNHFFSGIGRGTALTRQG